jgi:hypothetical protein
LHHSKARMTRQNQQTCTDVKIENIIQHYTHTTREHSLSLQVVVFVTCRLLRGLLGGLLRGLLRGLRCHHVAVDVPTIDIKVGARHLTRWLQLGGIIRLFLICGRNHTSSLGSWCARNHFLYSGNPFRGQLLGCNREEVFAPIRSCNVPGETILLFISLLHNRRGVQRYNPKRIAGLRQYQGVVISVAAGSDALGRQVCPRQRRTFFGS